MGLYVTMEGVNTLRLWSRYAVMLCRGESFGIPLMTRCVAIHGAERVWLVHGCFSVLTGVTEGSRVAFWVA
jgi:hypothetical protein